ncbi:hypothetical protein E1B28_000448 [Marasmius oreades]|uniref:Cerato-platanin n=1 Tax=Marasmius oreades TaxID=181124 RepID=A0A9P8AED5_9AGAR|nr:uncharacterized protein E1B28_000448 [Marasmius oreades]KAG7098504.1 hypothetical protein E1B28_000448 [Marasmius oreades]
MKFAHLLVAVFFALHSNAVIVQFDKIYDKPEGRLESVACSDGPNGLITRGYGPTFGTLPKFNHIGAASAIEGWNSEKCGTCWELKYTTKFTQRSIVIFAIDHTEEGFTISEGAMNDLTANQAKLLGRVDVVTTEVPCA